MTPADQLRRAGEQSLAAARGTRYAREVERILGGARAAASILQGIISLVGTANPADTGITNASNAVAWVNWALGGPLPSVVADNDVRILKVVFSATPALIAAVNAGAALLSLENPRAAAEIQGAAQWITRNWLPNLKTAVDAAYDALPPLAPPAQTTPAEPLVIGPTGFAPCPPGSSASGANAAPWAWHETQAGT